MSSKTGRGRSRATTQPEDLALAKGLCPFCECDKLLEGPRGGMCVNIKCSRCEAKFNVGPGGLGNRVLDPPVDERR